MRPEDRGPAILLGVYAVVWIALAIDPLDRPLWAIENLLVLIGLPVVILTRRWFSFSTTTYVAMFLFLVLHAVGAHYGYTQVPIPWEEWGFSRNHSDRVAHLAFGLLAVFPIDEILRRLGQIRRGWGEALTVASTFALAAFFEVVEWLAVEVGGDAFGAPEGGYLGTQGDPFDAVKDMALGLLGAILTTAMLLVSRRRSRAETGPQAAVRRGPPS